MQQGFFSSTVFHQNQPFLHPLSFDLKQPAHHFCSMNKIYPLKQAIITGITSALFATVAFSIFISLNRSLDWQVDLSSARGIIGLLSLIILGIGIYMGMTAVKSATGMLSYGQAVAISLLIGLTTGVVMSVIGFIYTRYINPGYVTYMIDEARKAMIADGKDAQGVANRLTGLKLQLSPAAQIFQAMVGQTVVGTVIGLIMGIFIRTKK